MNKKNIAKKLPAKKISGILKALFPGLPLLYSFLCFF